MARKKRQQHGIRGISVYQRGGTWSYRVTIGEDVLTRERNRLNKGGFADYDAALNAAMKAKDRAENPCVSR